LVVPSSKTGRVREAHITAGPAILEFIAERLSISGAIKCAHP
jgi:hypothetical protein